MLRFTQFRGVKDEFKKWEEWNIFQKVERLIQSRNLILQPKLASVECIFATLIFAHDHVINFQS